MKETFDHEHFIMDGHDYYLREDGIILDCQGSVVGAVREDYAGEYWVVENNVGDVVAQIHKNASSQINAAKLVVAA